MMKLHIEIEKTKPENPGLEGRLNPGFGFENSPGFRVRENPGCKPYTPAKTTLGSVLACHQR